MRRFAALAVFCLSVGCSSEPSPETVAQDSGAAADTMPPEDTAEPTPDTSTATMPDALATKPATPAITTVMPMAGAWHVTWKPNDTSLSKVELWRSNDGATATLVRTLAGTAKDWHDGAALGTAIKYCYTVKTFRGELASDASAEKCTK